MEINEKRTDLRKGFEEIVKAANFINTEMSEVKHPGKVARLSLRPKSGEYIVHGENGFTGCYRDSQGNLYEINIHRKKSK